MSSDDAAFLLELGKRFSYIAGLDQRYSMPKRKVMTKNSEAKSGSVGVFISWSGDTSRALAEALHSLIPNVFQDVTAFVSSNDIDAGSNWFGEISEQLAVTEFGILCLTRDNLGKQWIHFEAGALAKKITDRTRVVPYLHGVSKTDLAPPLSLFQGVKADKEGTLSLLKSLNGVRDQPFEQSRLQDIYERWRPEFEQTLAALPTIGRSAAPQRSERELLEEILARLRGSQHSGTEVGPQIMGLMGRSAAEARLNKDYMRVQLTLKIADLEAMALQTPDPNQKSEYKRVLSLLRQELDRLKYSLPF